MKEFKGTKEEWKLRKMKNQYHIHTKNDIIAATYPTYLRENSKVTAKTDEEEANAQLIVAAPELLEALQEIVEVFHREENTTAEALRIGKAQKAINKALL